MSKNGFNKTRTAILMAILGIILIIYAATMYEVEVLSLTDDGGASAVSTTYTTVTANRGSVLDRNGVELISSRPKYNVKLDRSTILSQDNTNELIYQIVTAAVSTGTEYTDTFPVTTSGPFSYKAEMSDTQRNRLNSYLEFFKLNEKISASDLIIWMRDHYGIDYTTSINDARLIIGVRYELELRVIMNTAEYVFAEDVGIDFITTLKEYDFPGVSIVTDWAREYHTDAASHLLGYVGLMNAEEYEEYGKLDYPMNATIGKDGVERAFEKYLHGVDGVMATEKDSDGNVIRTYMKENTQAGGNVFLTLDIYLQKVAEQALSDTINELNAARGPEQEKAYGGALVVEDLNSGELLACASYPTFDITTMLDNYSDLLNDPLNPMFNRATMGAYNPGSTFKLCTALTGLRTGTISKYTPITCTGRYLRYNDYQPKCWASAADHGTLDVVNALAKSCNIFFYTIGDKMGIDAINQTARDFGFGSKTGLEVSESSGLVYTVDYKKEATGEDWYAADTLIDSIGQRDMITPVQLANYCSSIANDGTLYKLTLLNKVMNEDYSKTLITNQPKVLKTVENEEGYLGILREGMRAVVTGGTARAVLAKYPVKIAAKTGTVQSDGKSMNNGVFICYAPADDPQIAISVVVENGGSGTRVITAAQEVLDYYFASTETATMRLENTAN